MVNLFSQGRCLDKGCDLRANSRECRFKRDGKVVAVGVRERGLYRMMIRVTQTQTEQRAIVVRETQLKSHANVAKLVSCDGIRVWHERLAHQNVSHIKQFLRRNGIKFIDEKDFQCEGCIYGKQHRLPFANRIEKSKFCGEVIHTDVCGPMAENSIGGSRYFLLFKDDFSHYRFVYFLKKKSEVPQKIETFINFVQAQTSHKIKVLRCDNGGEFMNNQVIEFLDQKGIRYVCTVPYTPEQNGTSERENRTLVEAARSMVYSRNIVQGKQFLWAEAVNTAVYVINRTGTSTVKDKTPFELWHEKRASVNHLNVFGNIVYAHIPKQKRKKIDKKSAKCVLVGYGEHSNMFRVYNFEKRSIEIVRDVIFEKESLKMYLEQNENNDVDCDRSVVVVDVDDKQKEIAESVNANVSNIENQLFEESVSNENVSVDMHTSGAEIENNENISQQHQSVLTVPSDSDYSDESLHSDSDDDDTASNNGIVDRISDFVGRISGRRICNVDSRNVVDSRLRSGQISEADIAFCLLAMSNEPKTYKEALESKDRNEWSKAMDEEYQSLIKNGVWLLVDRPKNESVIDNKWVFKLKTKPDGTIERYKARLVVRGFTQKYGVNYEETFSPVVRFSSVRSILAVSAMRKMKLVQFDVKTAFLYGDLHETVYMKQPVGYDDNSGKVCKLIKSLYGLKQASRCWNEKFTSFIKRFNFVECKADPCVFVRKEKNEMLILTIYVDDGLIASTSEQSVKPVIDYLRQMFEIKVSEANFYLGSEINRRIDGSLHMSQSAYTKKILNRFGFADANSVSTPVNNTVSLGVVDNAKPITFPYREAVGSLMYLTLGTRPDIAFGVSLVSRFLDNASDIHVTAVKRIFRYI